MPLDDIDPSLPPQPEIPQQLRSHNLLARGDRTFERSVNRRMHYKSDELKALLAALVTYQSAQVNRAAARQPLRDLEHAVVQWETKHPNEVQARGRLLPELKREIAVRMRMSGMVPTINNHVAFERGLGIEDLEHGMPVNLWRKTHSALWGAHTLAGTGISTVSNITGGGTLAMVGLGTTVFTVGAATGVGLVVGGCALMVGSSAVNAKASWSSRKHKKALEAILQDAGRGEGYCAGLCGHPRDNEEHTEILDSVLPYVIRQKRKKMYRRGIGSIPLVSLGETVRSIVRKAGKKINGTLGQEREAHAHTLAKHLITHDCQLAQAIVSELFSDDEEEWIRYQDFPIVAGLLMEKFKSV